MNKAIKSGNPAMDRVFHKGGHIHASLESGMVAKPTGEKAKVIVEPCKTNFTKNKQDIIYL